MRIIEWIKKNKLSSLLILFVAYFLFKNSVFGLLGGSLSSSKYALPSSVNSYGEIGLMNPSYSDSSYGRGVESVDVMAEDRKVVEETTLSLQVKDVSSSIEDIKKEAQSMNGFMVSANLSRPLEAASGNITIRVPVDKAEAMLTFLRNSAVKVVSESLTGFDVTDQYSDITAKIAILEKTKKIFEDMLSKAVNVEEILQVQREILNLQSQIDSYKGQALYLEKTSSSLKITTYLSTDEYSLPFAPQDGFRPNVIFKQAVRALVITIRGLATKAIWVGVYSIIWVPVLLIFLLVKK
ncbi:MAG: DUF4349 domain-containing protein, partial [bacterium]